MEYNFELHYYSTLTTKQIIMKANMGSIDRIIRIIIALVFFILKLTGIVEGITANILVALGVVFLLTAAISFCPVYLPFKFSTKK